MQEGLAKSTHNNGTFLVLRSNSFPPEMDFYHPKKKSFGFLVPKKVKPSFLVPKKGKSSFLVPKKGKSTFLVPKKGKSAFLVPKKGKIPLFWSFLVSKNCLLVRPRKFSFG